MKEHDINLSALIPHGSVDLCVINGQLNMTTTQAIHDVGYNICRSKIHSYALVPGRFHLPFRIDMTAKIDSPEMLILIGDGHITVGSPRMENRRIEDIAEPVGKPRHYHNSVNYNQFFQITMVFNREEMQILINGAQRYYSTKERYMKSVSLEAFPIAITCTKRVQMSISSIKVTEYEHKAPITHFADTDTVTPELITKDKPTFQSCIENLPPSIKQEIIKTEEFLKKLKHLKFKRTIDKYGNKFSFLASSHGVSYAVYLNGELMHHSFQWYIVTNSTSDKWHRKADMLEETLEALQVQTPELADRIFYNLNECIGCRENCLARSPYTYKSRKKISCHGHVVFKMLPSDFQDVRDFFAELDMVVADEKEG